jgi:hypothetical protein
MDIENYEKGYDGTLLTDLFNERFGNDMTDEKNNNTPESWYFTATFNRCNISTK